VDWERITPYLDHAMGRFPSLREAGVRTMFCGPESFTPDTMPQLGEAPELRNFFVACGLNSLGILFSGGVGAITARWIADGVPPVDVTGMTVDRTVQETSRRFRKDRAVEQLDCCSGTVFPTWHLVARNVRRSVVTTAGGRRRSLGRLVGWEYPGGSTLIVSTAELAGFGRNASFPYQAGEHRAVREAVGMLDMSIGQVLVRAGTPSAR
jgi:4-methylaminobutanoate oxidase (formaldehyde-forming)